MFEDIQKLDLIAIYITITYYLIIGIYMYKMHKDAKKYKYNKISINKREIRL